VKHNLDILISNNGWTDGTLRKLEGKDCFLHPEGWWPGQTEHIVLEIK
jgi:hypothetical protein